MVAREGGKGEKVRTANRQKRGRQGSNSLLSPSSLFPAAHTNLLDFSRHRRPKKREKGERCV